MVRSIRDRLAVRSGCVGNDGVTWNGEDALVVCERGAIADSMFADDWSNDSFVVVLFGFDE